MTDEVPPRFAGSRVLITGGGRGIGRQVALAFAQAGAPAVGVVARTGCQLASVHDELAALGVVAVSEVLDVGDADAVAEVVPRVEAGLGGVDVLVNCAGAFDLGDTVGFSAERAKRLFDTNVLGTLYVCQQVAPGMLSRGAGKIVNFASLLSFTAFPGRAAYSASKAALVGLTRSLALEWAPAGITVNAVTPGMIEIETPHPAIAAGQLTADAIVARIPAGRRGKPADVVGGVLFLAGPESDYVTGHSLTVDGGWLVNGWT